MSEHVSEGMDSSLGRSDPAVPAISRAVSDSERLSPQPEGLRPQGREKVLPEPSEHTGSPLPVNPCTFIVVPAALPRSEHRLCSAGWSPALPSPVCSLCAGPGPMRAEGAGAHLFPLPLEGQPERKPFSLGPQRHAAQGMAHGGPWERLMRDGCPQLPWT